MKRWMLTAMVAAVGLSACQETEVVRLREEPDVLISYPAPGEGVPAGITATFTGTVSDSYDQAVDLGVDWVIDDGTPVTAAPNDEGDVELLVATGDLELGPHLLQLAAEDSDAMIGRVTIQWLVVDAEGAPEVTITAPTDGAAFMPGSTIAFTGSATDEADDPGSLTHTWSSDVDGELWTGSPDGTGRSSFSASDLSTGAHTITLAVKDSTGLTGTDNVLISVAEETDPVEEGDIIFTEMMINPNVVKDEIGEWIELYNRSGGTIDLAGYYFTDRDFDNEPLRSFIMPPKTYIVLCADPTYSRNGGVECDLQFTRAASGNLALGNNGDELELRGPDDQKIAEIRYEKNDYTRGVAIGLDPAFHEQDLSLREFADMGKWCDQTTIVTGRGEPGTPGFVNDPCG